MRQPRTMQQQLQEVMAVTSALACRSQLAPQPMMLSHGATPGSTSMQPAMNIARKILAAHACASGDATLPTAGAGKDLAEAAFDLAQAVLAASGQVATPMQQNDCGMPMAGPPALPPACHIPPSVGAAADVADTCSAVVQPQLTLLTVSAAPSVLPNQQVSQMALAASLQGGWPQASSHYLALPPNLPWVGLASVGCSGPNRAGLDRRMDAAFSMHAADPRQAMLPMGLLALGTANTAAASAGGSLQMPDSADISAATTLVQVCGLVVEVCSRVMGRLVFMVSHLHCDKVES
jgi:hypothetical protein